MSNSSMRIIFIFTSILFTQLLFSQKVLSSKSIFFDHNIAYQIKDVTVFSGIAEYGDNKGFLTKREQYEDGIMTKSTSYYTVNVAKGKEVVSQETTYINRKIDKRINYNVSGEKYEYIEYDENGDRKYSEYWKDGKFTKQYYKKGKLDGIAITKEKNGDEVKEFYKDGELLKVVKTPFAEIQKGEANQ